jgi:hypothetical protein
LHEQVKDGMTFLPAPPEKLAETVMQGSVQQNAESHLEVKRQHLPFIEANPILDRPPMDMVPGRLRNPLFVKDGSDVHEVDMNDVDQGGIGNCYVMASIAAVARQDPERIKNMVHDNGDGTYTVTFKEGWKDVPITVSGDFPGGIIGLEMPLHMVKKKSGPSL